jgi:hypothetical protein
MQYTTTISFKPGFSNSGIPLDWDRYPMVYLEDGIFVKEGYDYHEVMSKAHKNHMLLYEMGDFVLDNDATDNKSVRYK